MMPLFPELRPYLEAVRDEVNPGIDVPLSDPVITRYRDTNSNLRTQLLRILRRAGVTPWERLFHNLRASRQTELADEFPAHIVADWMCPFREHHTRLAGWRSYREPDGERERAVMGCGAAAFLEE